MEFYPLLFLGVVFLVLNFQSYAKWEQWQRELDEDRSQPEA
jgi:hypothetical protein